MAGLWGGGGSALETGIILHTTDGGQTWIAQRQGSELELDAVAFVDTLYGWAAGYDPQTGAPIIHTTNGGITWQGQFNANGDDMVFLDRQTGWTVDLFGLINHTSDGGATWEMQPSYTTRIFSGVDFIDHQTGWVVGWQGAILHTTSGGVTSIRNTPDRTAPFNSFILHANYPNPFNLSTTIRLEMLKPIQQLRMDIYDILGRRIRTLFKGRLPVGMHEFSWDGTDSVGRTVSSGIYFYQVSVDFSDGAKKQTQTQKMLLLK
ncbi:MAG: T9SS type A sorting domain-containing protein [candidate division Zixibacteria bacterium]|nr:T9SS type A sorting domain-containing protein [candidate division Zixibacteria bacterium]NIS44623.1 T9SS type A sorting domain-containing protein [candidate division Zixibacteria bacterium]NIU12677.1 T9SS type A sorting domain-containing protein [candidate division Zixibacteria bacterium]NIV04792.1 T9SS type A sorting domain-containing protein [candidate division Zixibacteria bacterium]NIX54569.1 T9SS type A sorting domain-containing protein [candidate division Zixibacteria bacterium]